MISIAIDGPGGAGKTSISKEVAKRLEIVYVDTGALYRTVGYFVRENGLDVTQARNPELVNPLLSQITVEMKHKDGSQHVFLNGVDLGDKIRQPDISMYASAVSSLPKVREFLLETQRSIAKQNSVIMDGRDIGTVILPNADVKIFLTASDETRARRRYEELRAKGLQVSFESVLEELILRDKADRERDIAPAVAADDAIILDNSDLSFEQSVEKIIEIVKEKTSKL